MMDSTNLSTWLEIDCQAIKTNVNLLHSITSVPLIAVVKANGYGHGLFEAATAVLAGGSEWLAVSRIEEAVLLREKGIRVPILVLGFTSPGFVQYAAREEIRLNVYGMEIAEAYHRIALEANLKLKVHAKINVGMNRLGVSPLEGLEFLRQLNSFHGLEVEGLFTHFPQAASRNDGVTLQQIDQFTHLVSELEQAQLRPALIHAANSAAALYYPSARFDLVRCGIAVFGLPPSKVAPLLEGFQPALTWKSRLVSVKTVQQGEAISYNAHYVTRKPERIGVLALGYADGYRRYQPNQVLIHGKRAEIVGSVCMDQCMLRLDDIPEAVVGDIAVVLGKDQDDCIDADELATRWHINLYDTVCSIAARVPRLLS